MQRFTGTRVTRVEDPRILTGGGLYIDDRQPHGLGHAAFVRSPFAHARVHSIDTAAARAHPGVIAVFTAADLARHVAPIVTQGPPGMSCPRFTCLATDKVRMVGDTVALVIADSRAIAEDACELVEVEYEELAGIGSIARALASDGPRVWDELEGNVLYEEQTTYGDPDAAFTRAAHTIRETFVQHRITNCPMETRGVIATYEPGRNHFTYIGTLQGTQMARFVIGSALALPTTNIDVILGDVGGSFGQKTSLGHEELAVCAAAKALPGRPVKWIEDRTENLSVGGQAREETVTVEAAVDADGRILGLRLDMVLAGGAYPTSSAPITTLVGTLARVLIPGAYDIADYSFRHRAVFTNKATYVAYRGPWAIETWVRERVLDRIGRELGLDPVEVRRRNLLGADAFPHKLPAGPTLSGITLRSALDKSERVADWAGFRAEQASERARGEGGKPGHPGQPGRPGRVLGLGVVSFIEPAPGPADYGPSIGFNVPPERAMARLEVDGSLSVYTSQAPHGQGHETTLAQLAADELGVPMSAVRIIHSDSRTAPFSMMGTGGSRAATVASGSVIGVARAVRDQVAEIVAHMLEANPTDIEVVDGVARVKGSPDKAMPLAQVAMTAWLAPHYLPPGRDPGIEATFDFRAGDGGWTQSVHSCFVEIDPETGVVKVLRYVVVEDCGDVINPAIVEGQIRGGIAQGIGEVLYEHSAYDDDGTFKAGTFMDYLIPSSMEIPPIEIHHVDATVVTQEVNFRGVGEGGAIGAPAAVCSAVEDALSPWNAKVLEQYLPPSRVLELMGVIPVER